MTKIFLPLLDEDLLNECSISAYYARGSENRQQPNTPASAIRLTHNPSGIVIKCQVHPSEHLNKKECLLKLREEVDRRNYRKPKRPAISLLQAVVVKNKANKAKGFDKTTLSTFPPAPENR
ncbi:peptide chain release factor-like protein [Parachlamydia sp. AcF125]|uniref:peptide chain release factor family protein n=1 Tax=Parachlamydia sp. AcF125 TaxID=2795736 RepID=UPI001BC93BD1|nr:peptide chain release factor-like protein [Parachlamydia sp. AcF125]MBS4168708.1 Peptide chain release factor RF1 [Parachlamydia sp. AcF125]